MRIAKPMIGTAPALVGAPVKLADPFYKSREWIDLVSRIKLQRGNRCEVVGCCSGHRIIIGDHIREVKDGGARLDPRNIRLMCLPCHNGKTARSRTERRG